MISIKLIQHNKPVSEEFRVGMYIILHMDSSGYLSRNLVALMAQSKKKDLATSFEEAPALPMTWLLNYFLDLVRYPGIFSYLLHLVFVTPGQQNLTSILKLTQIVSSD